MTKVAVFQFPGTNCEYETVESLKAVSLDAEIVAWNSNDETINEYDAYVLPGGFSFQDRVRAGVVSSKLPMMKALIKAADEGKPVLGICNGCQILAELGLVPNSSDDHRIDIALAHNMKNDNFYGFVCDWVYVRIQHPEKNIFTKLFTSNDVVPIQINHGEGNFKFREGNSIFETPVTHLQYCTNDGQINAEANPNGADMNIAALSNKAGNVLAMMPHPERGSFLYQVPRYLKHDWAEKKKQNDSNPEGPWHKLFLSLASHLNEKKHEKDHSSICV